MRLSITRTADVPTTGRTMQLAGLFDVPLTDKQTLSWDHSLPLDEHDWGVGLIVGPSGSGKSVLAHEAWPGVVIDRHDWDPGKALIDGFDPKIGISKITEALVSVGFGTIPAWLRPYQTLSNGEQFRADMARSIVETDGVIVIDEFTSVVDRQVAKIASHAIAKTVRRNERQFVAVTCHYDVIDWLQPDWMYDVASGSFTWRSVQPHPPLTLEIRSCPREAWSLFAHHHYLSDQLASGAKCFIAHIGDRPVAFSSYIHFMHPHTNSIKMGHRLVVLPDYQGLGIAARFDDWLGQYLADQGKRYRNVVAHPGMIRMYMRSPRWRETTNRRSTRTKPTAKNQKGQLSTRRLVVRSFEYQPPKEIAS
jgi:energy-coupling factor transporter ATP-binding protein EcfA2